MGDVIARLEELEARATRGEWDIIDDRIVGENCAPVAAYSDTAWTYASGRVGVPMSKDDMAYIVALKNEALPELRALKARCEAAEALLSRLYKASHALTRNIAEFETVTDGEFLDALYAAEDAARVHLQKGG